MRKYIIVAMVAALAALPAGAQTLKAVKDKQTKLFGYQDASKNWVIEPQFDNAKKFHGPVAAVMIKEDRTKIWGVVDTNGNLVIPIECLSVDINEKEGLIYADRRFMFESESYNSGCYNAWGVYDLEGNTIWEPQFASKPYFNREGCAVVNDKATQRYGVVSQDGRVIVPLDNIYAAYESSFYNVLDNHFTITPYSIGSSNNLKIGAKHNPNVDVCSIPYDTGGDDIKAIAYGHRRLGVKLPCNTIFRLGVVPEGHFQSKLEGLCESDGFPVDWGYRRARFVRLELAAAGEDTKLVCPDPRTGANYTVVANLYETDGTFLHCLSPDGMLYADLDQGVAYQTATGEYWFIANDINWPLEHYRTTFNVNNKIDTSNVEDMIGLSDNEKNDLRDYFAIARLHREVEMRDVGNVLSFALPAELANWDDERFQSRLVENYKFMYRKYRMNQVYPIASYSSGLIGDASVKVRDELHAHMHLKYMDGFGINYRDPVYWGPYGDRYIRIVPIPKQRSLSISPDGVIDDRPDGRYVITFEFRLYEDDGTYVQTLGTSKAVWFGGEGVVGFKDTEWVFTTREPRSGSIRFNAPKEPFTNRLSEFDRIQF